MKIKLNILFILLLSTTGFSQYSGYFGKKNYAGLNIRGFYPLFYGSNTVQDPKSETYDPVKYKKGINTAISISAGHAFNNRLSLSLELGAQSGEVIQSHSTTYNYKTIDPTTKEESYKGISDTRATPFQTRTLQFMPTLEWSGDGGMAPVGLINKFGFGICRTKVIAKEDYQVYANENDINGQSYNSILIGKGEQTIDSDISYKSALVFYELGMRIPINDKLVYHFGVRYLFGFMTSLPEINIDQREGYVPSLFNREIGNMITSNFIQANFGLNFVF